MVRSKIILFLNMFRAIEDQMLLLNHLLMRIIFESQIYAIVKYIPN